MRTCIKCKRELPDGMFRDMWYATNNICRECKNKYQNKLNKEKREWLALVDMYDKEAQHG
jgi:hypothetical protein